MRRNLLAVGAAALALGSAHADTATVGIDVSWAGSSPGVGVFLGLTASDFSVDGLDFSSHGEYECGCFGFAMNSFAGDNEETGRSYSASLDPPYYTVSGFDVSFRAAARAEFAIPAGATLDVNAHFHSLHGDSVFSFTDPSGARTLLTSAGNATYAFTNTTDSVAYEWLDMSLGMTGTVPEPPASSMLLIGTAALGLVRKFRSRGVRLAP